MTYTIYDPTTGQIISTFSTSDTSLVSINVGSSNYIEGVYNGDQYYIENNQPILFPQKPINFLQEYTFNWATKAWDIDLDKTTILIRNYRNNLLNQTIDKVNPIWYATLTVEQQQELQTYRQQLLDVPQQTGFPTAIEWPTKPTWL